MSLKDCFDRLTVHTHLESVVERSASDVLSAGFSDGSSSFLRSLTNPKKKGGQPRPTVRVANDALGRRAGADYLDEPQSEHEELGGKCQE